MLGALLAASLTKYVQQNMKDGQAGDQIASCIWLKATSSHQISLSCVWCTHANTYQAYMKRTNNKMS